MIKFDTSALKLAETQLKMKAAVGLYADAAGRKLEAEAKRKAPWVDRTSHARQTIQGGRQWEGNKCNIYVCGNKNYSPYLEFANEKKNAVLFPTIARNAPEIVRGMNNLLGR